MRRNVTAPVGEGGRESDWPWLGEGRRKRAQTRSRLLAAHLAPRFQRRHCECPWARQESLWEVGTPPQSFYTPKEECC